MDLDESPAILLFFKDDTRNWREGRKAGEG